MIKRRYQVQFSCAVTESMYDQVKKLTDELGVSMAHFTRKAIAEALNRKEQQKQN